MDSKNIEKMNKLKNILVKNSHKLDLILGLILIGLGIHKYINNEKFAIALIIVGIISLILYILKPVKKMDDYMNKKIIAKQNDMNSNKND